jgi:hypothetical protein
MSRFAGRRIGVHASHRHPTWFDPAAEMKVLEFEVQIGPPESTTTGAMATSQPRSRIE